MRRLRSNATPPNASNTQVEGSGTCAAANCESNKWCLCTSRAITLSSFTDTGRRAVLERTEPRGEAGKGVLEVGMTAPMATTMQKTETKMHNTETNIRRLNNRTLLISVTKQAAAAAPAPVLLGAHDGVPRAPA